MSAKPAIAWGMLGLSTVGNPLCMWLWWKDILTTRQMVGVTLELSLIALQFSAITTLFVV